MRDSGDSDDYGVSRRGRKRGKFDDDEAVFAKRDRHLPRLRAEDANEATDGLPEGDRWPVPPPVSHRGAALLQRPQPPT
jgi:hypothetical protein